MSSKRDFNIRFQNAMDYCQKLNERLILPLDLIKIDSNGNVYDAETDEPIPQLSQISIYDMIGK